MAMRPKDLVTRLALLALGLAVSSVLGIVLRASRKWHHPFCPSNPRAVIIFAIALFVVVLNQLVNSALLGVNASNEARSVLVAGFEVHRLNWG